MAQNVGSSSRKSLSLPIVITTRRSMLRRRQQIVSVLRQILIAFGIAALFALLSIFPSLGYHGSASTEVVDRDYLGFWIVDANYSIALNPVLYPFSWASGRGSYSSAFQFVSVPTYSGYEYRFPVWRSSAELNEEAIIIVLIQNIIRNFVPNVFVLTAIGFLRRQALYFVLFGGIIGFAVGSAIGSVVGLSVAALIVYFIVPRVEVLKSLREYITTVTRSHAQPTAEDLNEPT